MKIKFKIITFLNDDFVVIQKMLEFLYIFEYDKMFQITITMKVFEYDEISQITIMKNENNQNNDLFI